MAAKALQRGRNPLPCHQVPLHRIVVMRRRGAKHRLSADSVRMYGCTRCVLLHHVLGRALCRFGDRLVSVNVLL